MPIVIGIVIIGSAIEGFLHSTYYKKVERAFGGFFFLVLIGIIIAAVINKGIKYLFILLLVYYFSLSFFRILFALLFNKIKSNNYKEKTYGEPNIKDSNLKEIYDNMDKIKIKDVNPKDVRFILYSMPGAMGEPGVFTILSEGFKASENNYITEDISEKELLRVMPEYEDIKGNLILSIKEMKNWAILNLGLGNYLFVHNDVFDDFCEGVRIAISDFNVEDYAPIDLYENWIYGALFVLSHLKDSK